MATWQAIVDGTTYSLSDGNPFKLLGISGIGNAPVRRLEERGPFQDGSTDIGYRLDARLMNLNIQIAATSLSAADTHRDTLGLIFNPRGGRLILLRCTRDDGAVRQIDCYAVNMVDMPAELGQRDLSAQRVGVQLKAPNPIWYNPTIVATYMVPAAATAWYLIGGLAGTAEILTFGTAIGENVDWTAGTVDVDSDFSVAYRAAGSVNFGTAAPNIMNAFNFYHAGTSTSNRTGISRVTNDLIYVFDSGAPVQPTYAPIAGTVLTILNKDATGIYIYRDNTLVATLPNDGKQGISSGQWNPRFSGANYAWGTITHGAVYRKSLNANERAALQNILTLGIVAGTIVNSGSWDEYPLINVPGSATSPIIQNLSTGETLNFSGAIIPENITYTIDARYGYKTVTDSAGINQIAKLSDDSDLATFHISPGVNVFQVTNGGTVGTVTILSYDRYLGL